MALLEGGAVYSVGGRVRDEVLGELGRPQPPAADLDYLITGLELSDVIERLRQRGSAELVGASFGVVKFTVDGSTVDVALPRRERPIGPHHRDFEVQSAPDVPVEDDLARRDFRINMMARRLADGALVDPYGGREDLEAHRLDITRPEVFEEDPLRILRGAQFAARFELTPTPAAMSAMRDAAPRLPSVSADRMADEMTKLLTRAERPSIGFEILREAGALTYVMPELLEGWAVEQNEFHRYTVYYHSLRTVDAIRKDLILRLAALLHDIGKPRTKSGPHFYRHELVGTEMTLKILERLRFGRDVGLRVSHLVRHHMFSTDDAMSDAAIRRFISRVGTDAIEGLFALRKADVVASGLPERNPAELDRFAGRVRRELAGSTAFGVPQLAIDGRTVIEEMVALGLAPADFRGDERVGDALRHLLDAVLDDPTKNETSMLRKLAREYLRSGAAEH